MPVVCREDFNSSPSGSDFKDHVFIKEDGNYTYVVPDIPYHMDKMDRGFIKCIDVLGISNFSFVLRLFHCSIFLKV